MHCLLLYSPSRVILLPQRRCIPMSYKCVILVGLLFQALAAIPPVWILWAPEPAKSSGELGVITQIIEKLSQREKGLLSLSLLLLFVGTALQAAGLLFAP
jgi:hypothetical protein